MFCNDVEKKAMRTSLDGRMLHKSLSSTWMISKEGWSFVSIVSLDGMDGKVIHCPDAAPHSMFRFTNGTKQ